MSKSDGKVIIDTLIDTDGFDKRMNTMQKQIGGLGGAVKKLGTVIAATFAVGKIIQFGKECIELGSDLQEVQNVVDVVFTTMSDKVDEFAKNAAEAAGLSETMAKRYTGTFGAMAKAFNFAEDEAFDMSTSLTQLAGDVASFYNIKQDEAYTKLKSVFTGETETLKDLGVVMTQNALDAYAMANGYGMTTKQMTEQQKVALRYKFVLDQLSAASGDFQRTSDGWANQMRILRLNLDSLKANIGQGFINIFTPVIKVLNIVISRLATAADYFRQFTELFSVKQTGGGGGSPGSIAGDLAEIEEGYSGIADATDEATRANKKYLSGLDEVSRFGESDISTSSGLALNISGNVDLDQVSQSAEDMNQSLPVLFDVIANGIELFTNALSKLQPFGDWFWNEFITPFNELLEEEFNSALSTADGFLEFVNGVLTGDWERAAKGMIQWATSMTSGLDNAFEDTKDLTLSPFVSYLKYSFEPEMEGTFTRLAGNVLMTIIGMATDAEWKWESMTTTIDSLTDRMGDNVEKRYALMQYGIAFILKKMVSSNDETWRSIGLGTYSWANWIYQSTQNPFKATSTFFAETLKLMANSSNERWKKTAYNIYEWALWIYRNTKSPFSSLKTAIDNIFTNMGISVKNRINTIIYVLNRMIYGVTSGINSMIGALNGLSFDVPDWVPIIGGGSFGLNIGYVSAPYIPYLASGAVIPPNAPFMAMLGDQKNGRNLEMPEALLRKIVREESGGSHSGGMKFTAQINRRVLFDEFIEEAKIRQMQTGKNLLALE